MEGIAVGEEFCDLNDFVSGSFLAAFERVLFLALMSAIGKCWKLFDVML